MSVRRAATPRARRYGGREGSLSDTLRAAVVTEIDRIADLEDPERRAGAVGDLLAGLDAALDRAVEIREDAVVELKDSGVSYAEIARRVGLSKARVAKLGQLGHQRRSKT